MPVVTLQCSNVYFPPDEDWGPQFPHTPQQQAVIDFVDRLPQLFVDHDEELRLEPTSPEGVPGDGVQVDIKKLHRYAKNAPDIWVYILITDELPKSRRDRIRDILMVIIQTWIDRLEWHLRWALDIFYGPASGCYTDSEGRVINIW